MQEQKTTVTLYENKIAGLCGAFLFALPGGLVWYLLYQIGFLAAISGLIAIVCSMKGYVLFSKKESTFGVVASSIMSVLVMVIAWYFCLASDVYTAYADWFAAGEVDYAPTFLESISSAYLFLLEPEICLAYLKDLGLGLLFCVIGGYSNVRSALNAQKLAGVEASAPASEPEIAPNPTDAVGVNDAPAENTSVEEEKQDA